MNNPKANSNSNSDNQRFNDEATKSWWSDLTSSSPTDSVDSFNPDSFTQEAESSSWLDIFKPRK